MFDLRFLHNLKQKLTTGNRGSIYLNAQPERYLSRLDLADLNLLNAQLSKMFLAHLTQQASFHLALSPDGSSRDDLQKTQLEKVLRRLAVLTIENNDHFSEQGVKTFGFGFPILLYRDKKDPNRVLKAPLFIWYLDIERNFKRANEWILSRQEDAPIIHNVVLAAYLRNHAAVQLEAIEEELLEDALLDKDEIANLASRQLLQLHPNLSPQLAQEFRAILEQPIARFSRKQALDQRPLEKAQVLWSGVFGLFKSQKESIINDLDYFIDHIDLLQHQIEQQNQHQQLMQHCFAAVDTDPSQQHLLHLLGKGNNLVLQGPPGTGKSQTLTGIISNILSNQGTCLVVCEKKTALEVVQQNLIDIGLGELTVIIEDVYRDRQAAVNSVRERAQKQYPLYQAPNSYSRLLQNYMRQIEKLQAFHEYQIQALLEEKTWTELVYDFLEANHQYDKQVLEPILNPQDFNFSSEELESILPIFEQAQTLLQPIGTIEQPLHQLHNHFFENSTTAAAKRSIQRSLTATLRTTRKAQDQLRLTHNNYQEQLEQHYQEVYVKKMHLTDGLFLQCKFLLEQHVSTQLKQCQKAQQAILHSHQQYQNKLEQHFEHLYLQKIAGIDQASNIIKTEIYGSVNAALQTIKEAKEDIMASLYEYEKLLEQHFEAVYMQKMDWVDSMMSTIEAGMSSSPFYFKKNKGIFRAILHGVGSKYKQLEQDKQQVLKQFAQLKKLHQKHQYFKFSFIATQNKKAFTFEEILVQLDQYRMATDDWHLQQQAIIQKEVRALNSRYSLKAVPYKEQAQSINQHLSSFRSKILRNKLIPIDFSYKSLRLRDRFDQLETIEQEVLTIKTSIDAFMQENEASWQTPAMTTDVGDQTLRQCFEDLKSTHKKHRYFEHSFIKLGRPSKLEDYYKILQHLSTYRSAVEEWYPTCAAVVQEQLKNFKPQQLYAPLQFEAEADHLTETINAIVQDYNHTQLLDLPFQLESILFQDQLAEFKVLEQQIENWQLNLEQFLQDAQKHWLTQPHKPQEDLEALDYSLEGLQKSYESLIKTHRQYDYFDVIFEVYTYPQELIQQSFIQNLIHYRNWTIQWYQDRETILSNALQTLSPTEVSPHVPLAHKVASIGTELEQFQVAFNEFKHFKTNFSFTTTVFGKQLKELEQLEQQILAVQHEFEHFEAYYHFRLFWIPLSQAQQAAYKGLAAVGPDDWTAAFTSWYLSSFLAQHAANIPDQISYAKHQELLVDYHTELQKMLVAHSLRYWRSQQTQNIEQFHREKAPIKLHSLYNKRGHVGGRRTPLRKIIATSPKLFCSFFPILLVSPSVCSAILPLEPNFFDAVIFDEASQLRLEDTFCALIRGRYKVISGDSQQMPPSDYFHSNTVLIHEEEEEEDNLVQESIDFLTSTESLLEYALAEGNYTESFLEVHYRSQHPYLIDFSNAAFYGNRLAPMPPKHNYTPIDFFAVNGQYINYTNLLEAQKIVAYLIEVAQQYKEQNCPSIGIATFNIHQRNLILELLQEQAVQDNAASAQLQKLFMKGLFVKNLENIQGDERDILVISTTFGYREDGTFIQNFGPINKQKGYRLLNVIITRAKQKLAIFTSIPSKYYESYRTEISQKGTIGKGVFYAYLAYAKAVSQQDYTTQKAILKLLYEHSAQKPVDSFLHPVNDNIFKQHVANFLEQHFPNRVQLNYQYAGFQIPLLVQDVEGQPKWAFDFDTFHQYLSEEAYAWDLFRQHHLKRFGLIYERIWSKDWWQDEAAAKNKLLQFLKA